MNSSIIREWVNIKSKVKNTRDKVGKKNICNLHHNVLVLICKDLSTTGMKKINIATVKLTKAKGLALLTLLMGMENDITLPLRKGIWQYPAKLHVHCPLTHVFYIWNLSPK